MTTLGFTFRPDDCTGCKACQVACKDKNALPAGHFFRRVEAFKLDGQIHTYSGACNHCAQPGCVDGCPTGALYKAADGTVQHHAGKCIGCGACIWNCPYGVPFLSPTTGISQKCDTCADLRRAGQQPACVQACITHCLHFGESGEDAITPVFLPDNDVTTPALRILPGKRQQAKQVQISTRYRNDTHETFLVLGGGVAALSAAEAIRQRNQTAKIILISAENALPYSRPMLSKAPLRGFKPQPFQIQDASWYAQHKIEVWLETGVQALRPAARQVCLHDGRVIDYSRCIYALGAQSYIPPIAGAALDGVFSIRTLEDISALRRWLVQPRRAVLIGGGVIGLEIALELKKYGCDVTVLESAPMLMGRVLDDDSSRQLAAQLEAKDIAVHTGITIDTLCGDSRVSGVKLNDGRTVGADLVIVTCGIQPNSSLAQQAGVETRRGIVVDDNMQTNFPGLYACGDCAEWQGTNLAVWSEAMEQGRVAGANAAGDPERYHSVPAAVLMNGAIALYAEGDTGKSPDVEQQVFTSTHASRAAFLVNPLSAQHCVERYFFKNDTLVGGVLSGDLTQMRILSQSIKDKLTKRTFLEKINAAR